MPTRTAEQLKTPAMPTPPEKQPTTPLERLQALLRELFQLDTADLDFGLYHLFHLKRAEVEAFLGQQLQVDVEKAFASAAGAEREGIQKRVEELAQRARESIAEDAILPNGEPNPAHAGTKAIKEYIEAKAKLQAVEASAAQQAEVFNLLYNFFSRYYDDGDFIARRFFGARPAYAVPYNGEEVHFHWANRDQYYVKSGEAFRDYAFTVPTVGGDFHIRFQLVEATTAKDNTKGEVRFFFPLIKDIAFDKASRTLTVPFHYRLPTEEEVAKHGKNSKGQEALLDDAAPKIVAAVTDTMLKAALSAASPTSNGEDPESLLRRRLAHFTKKITSDFFVHKNLGAFLRQELEFFLRDQVVHEADLEGDFEAKRRTLRVFRKLAEPLITFLAQVEDAQKRLFEKKKFVLRTDYLVPIQHVPRSLWAEVLGNKAQLQEWKTLYALEPKSDLFNLKGKINEHVLDEHPTIVVDTRLFAGDFVAKLLEDIDDLEERIEGTLIHGDNLQGLRLLGEAYGRRVRCTHIDPPYNTDTSGFLYKNSFRHSSWLTMMVDRILAARELMSSDGNLLCHIDENEYHRLMEAFDGLGLPDTGTIIWDKRNPMLGKKGIATQHEYVCWRRFLEEPVYLRSFSIGLILNTAREIIARHGKVTAEARKEFARWITTHPGLSGGERAYKFLDERGSVYRGVAMGAPERRTDPKFFEPILHPITKKPCPVPPNGWSRAPETIRERLEKGEILFGPDEAVQPQLKVFLTKDSQRQVPSVIADAGRGKSDTDDLGINFPYCHPVSLYVEIIGAATSDGQNDAVLDFFAGSGTSGHATIKLNREDGKRRNGRAACRSALRLRKRPNVRHA